MTAQFKSVGMKFNPPSFSEQLNLEPSASSGRPWDGAEAPASACCDQTSVISAEHPRACSCFLAVEGKSTFAVTKVCCCPCVPF